MSEVSSKAPDFLDGHITAGSFHKESSPEVPVYKPEQSIFLALERDFFEAQLYQQFKDVDSATADALYEVFVQRSTPSVEPTPTDLARLEELMPVVKHEAEVAEEQWRHEEFFRLLTDTDPNTGETVSVYNASAKVKLDKGTPELRLFGLDGKSPITMWRFNFDVVPERDEEGNYVPYAHGEQVNVLTEAEQTNMDLESAKHLDAIWKDALATERLSETDQRYLEGIQSSQ